MINSKVQDELPVVVAFLSYFAWSLEVLNNIETPTTGGTMLFIFALEHQITLQFLEENQGGSIEFLFKIDNIIKFQKSKRVNYPFSKKPRFTPAFCLRNTVKRGDIG